VLEPASSPLVRVKLTGGAVIQVTPAGEQVDSAAAPYRDGCVRANPFLHRSQLVAVLNDRPVDRFRYLEGFLDLDQADKIRDVFAGSAQSAQQAAKSAKDQRERKIRDLINLLPAERRPLASTWEAFLRNLSDFAASLRLTEGPSASLEELLLTASKAKQLGEGEELAKRRAQLNAADKPLEGIARELARGLPDLKATSDHLAALAASAADSSLSDLLEHARRHLAASKPGTCPVCGQQVDASALLAQITQRLEQLKDYKAQSARLAQETTRWANAWRPPSRRKCAKPRRRCPARAARRG
jgi:hypothetical protein